MSYDQVQNQIQDQNYLPALLLVTNSSLTPGISGLVAGRLAETFNRPAVALASTDAEHLVAR